MFQIKNQNILTSILILISSFLYAQDSGYVETNGVKIYYETHGQGEPLLLLHGFSLSHKAWDLWINDLSENYRLIIPDLRGHGLSSNPTDQFTHRMSALDIYGLLDHLEIDHFMAMGQSTGAMTLMHMATIDSSRITSMILVAGTSFFPDLARPLMKAVTYEKWRPHIEQHHPGGEEQIRKLVAQFQHFAGTYEDMSFTPPYLASIKCPTLIIHGDRDAFFPVGIPVSFYASIPNSHLWIVPNEGHIPIGIYDRKSIWSDVLLKVMDEFFSGQWE